MAGADQPLCSYEPHAAKLDFRLIEELAPAVMQDVGQRTYPAPGFV